MDRSLRLRIDVLIALAVAILGFELTELLFNGSLEGLLAVAFFTIIVTLLVVYAIRTLDDYR
ncbi:hypothetical protein ACFQPA_14335 [Halomarina halobia]|uniref:CbaC protein n=1 Tax=Halomarina halobia TaxID=3033386 RepID=A0ABD6A9R1_9EURY|nr:hypothetical protein [Halomarina sp. PSR21]